MTNGTATGGSDYTSTNGTLTFSNGVTSRTVTVRILNNTTVETNETFTVGLSSPTGGGILSNAVTTITVIDDDFVLGSDAPPKLVLGRISFHSSGVAFLNIAGPQGAYVVVEASEDLVNWTPLGDTVLGSGPAEFVDPDAQGKTSRFYRLSQPAQPAGQP